MIAGPASMIHAFKRDRRVRHCKELRRSSPASCSFRTPRSLLGTGLGGAYFLPSRRAASASIMRSRQLASERPSACARRSAVALMDGLTRTFIAISRLSSFGFFIPPKCFRCRNRAAEKPDPAARKNRAKRFAFGLPQDLHMQLMFEPCVKRRSRLSAFPRRRISCGMTRRRFRASPANAPHAIERASEFPWPPGWFIAPHRSSASIDMVFRNERRVAKPQNAAACLQFAATCLVLAA
jgi:hypothetical protein